jgi:uncharacterized protein YcbK (DUF882 family)
VIVALLLLVAAPAFADPPRFFIMGSGRIVLVNGHTDERVSVRYRRDDNTYDEAAVARIEHAFRSRDDAEGDVSLRLIEILSKLQDLAGGRELVLISGYRSPEYNEGLRSKGVRAAGGSLHTEGLAADLAFPKTLLRPLWMKMREMECCGAGFYEKEGFLHIDIGRARFWEPQTSRVEENLSAGNARMFARTEFDRYEVGERIGVAFYAVTMPPVWIRKAVVWRPENERHAVLFAEGSGESRADCVAIRGPATPLRVVPNPGLGRGRLEIETCEPRADRTPHMLSTTELILP